MKYLVFVFLFISATVHGQEAYVRACAEVEDSIAKRNCSIEKYAQLLVNQMDRSVPELKNKYPDASFNFKLMIAPDGAMQEVEITDATKPQIIEPLKAAHALVKRELSWANWTDTTQIIVGETVYISSGSKTPKLIAAKQILCGKRKGPKEYYGNAKEVEEVLAGAFDINKYCGYNEKRKKKYKVDEIFVEFVPRKITGEEEEPENAYFDADEIAPLSRWIGSWEQKGILEITIIPKDERRKEKTKFILLNEL